MFHSPNKYRGFMPRFRITSVALLTLSVSLAVNGAGRSTKSSAELKTQAGQVKTQAAQLKSQVANQMANLPAYFEPNRGQTDASVTYLANFGSTRLFLTPDSAVFVLKNGKPAVKGATQVPSPVVRMRMVNAERARQDEGFEKLPGISNYFIGKDSSKWVSGIPQFAKVKRQGVYPGVDMVFYGNQRQLEYDFIVAPGADPSRIELAYDGVNGISTNAAGDLVLATFAGDFIQKKPKVYQRFNGKQVEVAAGYRIGLGKTVRFELARYDRGQPLVIDPVIVFNAVVGSSGDEIFEGIAVDSSFNTYVAGQTNWNDFPLVNALQSSYLATNKIFLFKLNAAGSALVYSTVLGGESNDYGAGVGVDAAGNAIVTGTTTSHQFPLAAAAQSTYGGDPGDGFVAKISPSGSALLYSTYLGGTGLDQMQAIAVDSSGNAYVTGSSSGAFPITSGSFQPSIGGGVSDCVITKYTAAGVVAYSSYLGGDDLDICYAVAADSNGSAYLTGVTYSANFPLTSGAAYGTYKGGPGDAFIARINSTGSARVYSTYFGGEGSDIAHGIAVDSLGNAYLSGITGSKLLPTTAGAYQTTNPSSSNAAFISKFNSSGFLVYSTFLSGTNDDGALGIAVDIFGIAYVVGYTRSPNFPMVAAVIGTKPGAPADTAGFAAALNAAGNGLVYSTFLGGQGASATKQSARAVVVDSGSNAYIVGQTDSLYYKNTNGALYAGYGASDIFVTKLSSASSSCVVSFGTATLFAYGSGTTFPVEVFAPSGCSWTSTASQSWVTLSGNTAATGSGSLTVSAGANSGTTRTAAVNFSTGQSITITQGPGGCTYAFSTTTGTAPAAGGTATAPLTAGSGCSFVATTTEPWLTITNGTGSGNVSISYNATANGLSSSRSGTIVVNNAVFTVTQPAAGGTGGTGPATVISASPAGGSGGSQVFTFTFASPAGYQSLTVVDALINNFLDGRQACYVAVVPSGATSAAVYLVNDGGDAGGPYSSMTLPSSGTVSNNQCSISGSGSSVSGSGNNLVVALNINFRSSFGGNKVLYLAAQNAIGNSGWQAAGTWNVPGVACSGPCVVSATPSHTNGSSGAFVYNFTDSSGVADVAVLNVIVNNFIDGRRGCYVAFAPSGTSGGTLYLVNDAGDASGPYATMTLPGTGTVSNSQCTITGSGSSFTAGGTNLTLTLNTTFSNFSGNKVMYLAARSGTVSSNWQAVGSITIP